MGRRVRAVAWFCRSLFPIAEINKVTVRDADGHVLVTLTDAQRSTGSTFAETDPPA
jgi:hypothetical protein